LQQAVLPVAYQGRGTLKADPSIHRYRLRCGNEDTRTRFGRRTGDVQQIVQSGFQSKPPSDSPCCSCRERRKPALGAEMLLSENALSIPSTNQYQASVGFLRLFRMEDGKRQTIRKRWAGTGHWSVWRHKVGIRTSKKP